MVNSRKVWEASIWLHNHIGFRKAGKKHNGCTTPATSGSPKWGGEASKWSHKPYTIGVPKVGRHQKGRIIGVHPKARIVPLSTHGGQLTRRRM